MGVDGEEFEEVYARWKAGEIKAVAAMRELGLTPSTFYRRVREYEGSKDKNAVICKRYILGYENVIQSCQQIGIWEKKQR